MKQQYDEIMEHIEVTEEMRGRILENLRKADLSTPRKKPINWSRVLRGAAAAAACMAVLLVGSKNFSWRAEKSGAMAADTAEESSGQGVSAYVAEGNADYDGTEASVVNGMVEYDSAEALAGAVGFAVPQLQSLPFEPMETVYTDYWGTMAQVEYRGQNEEWALLRKGAGEEPVSGDYNEYAATRQLELADAEVLLKGEETGSYTLAEWTANGYAYSLSLSQAQAEAWWQNALAEVMAAETEK